MLAVSFLPTPVAEQALGRTQQHPTLRTLLIGGDRLRQFEREPGFAVINNYGPTEATVVSSVLDCTDPSAVSAVVYMFPRCAQRCATVPLKHQPQTARPGAALPRVRGDDGWSQ